MLHACEGALDFRTAGGNGHRPRSRRERETLHQLIDAARRRAIDWEADLRCAGCGVEQVDPENGEHRYAAGCRTCADRHSKHRQRVRAAAR